ncbi:hypothetical protein [Chitinophaga caseinilytica]|uniref:hypothetical protein n=1 Tax=Chitinophaga caseinilytica TaxID=2267521 RepID=UPI003C2AB4E8
MKIELKYQTCNIADALCRNINNNFESVSFKVFDNGEILVKIILSELTEQEEEYIDDFIAEFSSAQESDCVLKPLIEVGSGTPHVNLVYKKL